MSKRAWALSGLRLSLVQAEQSSRQAQFAEQANNRHDSMLAAIALIALALASPVSAQTDNFTYELRIVPAQWDPGVACPWITGGVVSFWLEARVRANSLAPGRQNYGVMRATSGPAGQVPASITVNDPIAGSRLARSEVIASGPGGFALTGRMPLFRAGGPVDDATASPWHSATENAAGVSPFPSGSGNQFGAFDQNGDRLYGFDAYAGAFREGSSNPWIGDFPVTPVGQFSPWARMYRFDVLFPAAGVDRAIHINASAYLSAGVETRDIGGGQWPMRLTSASPGSGSASASTTIFCPSASAATPLGLGLLFSARRRR